VSCSTLNIAFVEPDVVGWLYEIGKLCQLWGHPDFDKSTYLRNLLVSAYVDEPETEPQSCRSQCTGQARHFSVLQITTCPPTELLLILALYVQARKTCIPFCNVNSTSSLPQHRDPQIHAELIELVVAQCVAVRFNSLLSQCHLWCYCGQEQPVTFGATVAENRPNTSGAIVVKSILSLPVLPGRIPFRLGNNARRACLSHFCHWYLCWQVAAPYSLMHAIWQLVSCAAAQSLLALAMQPKAQWLLYTASSARSLPHHITNECCGRVRLCMDVTT